MRGRKTKQKQGKQNKTKQQEEKENRKGIRRSSGLGYMVYGCMGVWHRHPRASGHVDWGLMEIDRSVNWGCNGEIIANGTRPMFVERTPKTGLIHF